MAQTKAWFIFYTTPGGEAKFRETLVQRLNEAGLGDRLLDFIILGGAAVNFSLLRSLTGDQPLWAMPVRRPGAMFARLVMDGPVWQVIQSMPQLTGYEGSGGQPRPYLPSIGPDQKASPDPNAPWKAGDRVHITAGPFNDFHGTVAEIDMQRRKVRVMVDFFGRPAPVELTFDQIEKEP